MRMYVGSTRSKLFIRLLKACDVGRVNHPESFFYPYEGEKWFADNGAFSAWKRGENLNEDKFLHYLDKIVLLKNKPQFLVLPDLIGEGVRSLNYSLNWLGSGKLPRSLRYYLPLQDGMSFENIDNCVGSVDGLFLGGTNRFKAKAYLWAKEAKKHNKPIHFGRCGALRRIWEANKMGFDSSDSSYHMWRKDDMVKFLSWIKKGHYDPDTYKQLFFPGF